MKNKLLMLDEKGVVWVNIRRHPLLDPMMRGLTRVGDGPLWIMVTLVLLGSGGGGTAVGLQLSVGLLFNVTLYKVLKTLFGRPRPFQQILVVEQGAHVPDEFSFPSGHMAAACVMTVVLSMAYPALLFPMISLSLLVGMSRVYLGMHYPSDVLAGGVLGTSSGLLAVVLI